ncbi:MAG: single-stranded-DNA-specific exonuclease RecJ [Eisenbergiella sp.]
MAKWFVAAKRADFTKIGQEFGISPVLARIIRNRDIIEEEEIRRYLQGTIADMYAPGLLKDMEKAVDILLDKIKTGRPIRIIGDYDADGICSTFILHKGLLRAGATADTAIPHRMKDGYGLNEHLVEDAFQAGIDTIITCDNGIAAAPQIEMAKEKGMTVIVTDHHEVPYEEAEGERRYILPPADAVIDPRQDGDAYPYKGICGAVVAYKVIEALYRKLELTQKEKSLLEELLELAAFATVCDVMELLDENRVIVKFGLSHMKNTANQGLRALMEVNGIEKGKLSAYHLGFVMGPCLNATGRLDTAVRALQLLEAEDRGEAVRIASDLKQLNDSRKEMTDIYVKKAIRTVEESGLMQDRVLVVYLPDCHESLAGIIAGRVREKYYKPVFVLTRGEEGVKGSGRSIETYHMYEEMTRVKHLFTSTAAINGCGPVFGGEGCGKLPEEINAVCTLTESDMEERVHIDVPMPVSHVSMEFVQELELLEPFGNGNPKPVFAQKDLSFLSARILGKNGNAVRFTVLDDCQTKWEMMAFGDPEPMNAYLEKKFGREAVERLYLGKSQDIRLSVTYYPSINTYQGNTKLQLVMQQYQ